MNKVFRLSSIIYVNSNHKDKDLEAGIAISSDQNSTMLLVCVTYEIFLLLSIKSYAKPMHSHSMAQMKLIMLR